MKHPFIVGTAVGVTGLVIWTKRSWFINLFHRLTAHFQGVDTTVALPDANPAAIVRQLRRYAFAAMQDQSPVVGITHASYALILLDTLEEMAGRAAIERAGYNVTAMRTAITACQDAHAKKLQACDTYMAQAMGVERGIMMGAGAAPRGA